MHRHIVTLLVILSTATLIAPGSSGGQVPGTRSACTKPAPSPEQAFSGYLPLADGNTWTYTKTVSGTVLAWEGYRVAGKGVQFVVGPSRDVTPGRSEETYSIKGKAVKYGPGLWDVKVEPDLSKARDGRYGGLLTRPEKILWGRIPSGTDVIHIGEVLIRESVFEGEKRHEGTLLVEPLKEGVEVMVQDLKGVIFRTSPQLLDVTVAAGRFPCSLEMTMTVEGTQPGSKWTTHSYYAFGVGLVREVQRDARNNEIYSLELRRYRVR